MLFNVCILYRWHVEQEHAEDVRDAAVAVAGAAVAPGGGAEAAGAPGGGAEAAGAPGGGAEAAGARGSAFRGLDGANWHRSAMRAL
jgi:hypothetical protein